MTLEPTIDHIHAVMKGMWLQGATNEEILYHYAGIGISDTILEVWIAEWGKRYKLKDKKTEEVLNMLP